MLAYLCQTENNVLIFREKYDPTSENCWLTVPKSCGKVGGRTRSGLLVGILAT